MSFWTLVLRSFRFRLRAHVGVMLGAAVGSAALVGALIVGDSVRETLRDRALERLGGAENALSSGDKFFEELLGDRLQRSYRFVSGRPRSTNRISILRGTTPASNPPPGAVISPGVVRPAHRATSLLRLPGTAARQDGAARANRVHIWGVSDYWLFNRPSKVANDPAKAGQWRQATDLPPNSVLLNETLAAQLSAKQGDAIILRVHKPSALSRDAVITPRDQNSVALRLSVAGVVTAEQYGNLELESSQAAAPNAFVREGELADAAGVEGRANVLLAASLRRMGPPSSLEKTKSKINQWLAKISPKLQLPRRWAADELPPGEQTRFLNTLLAEAFLPEDAELDFHVLTNAPMVELATKRIFLDDVFVAAATTPSARFRPPVMQRNVRPLGVTGGPTEADLKALDEKIEILTYLANLIATADRATPYSMITAAGPPYTPADLKDDEIIVNEWLAKDLQVKPGDSVRVSYFLADTGSRLVERSNEFRLRAVVPLSAIYDDRTLMPEFPGLAKAESTHDWDAGFPLVHKIRDEDEAYWKKYRGTPKAFVTLAAGQKMWANRFGPLTAIRWRVPEGAVPVSVKGALYENCRANLDPAAAGFAFRPVKAEALASANNAQDFGELFLAFSFFLILAALILMALLFQFGIEERTEETGILLAVGFTPKQVRRLLRREGILVAALGGIIGVLGGLGFARLMLLGLRTLWREAVASAQLEFHVSTQTLIIGFFASVIICAITIAIVLRKQARQPARELLANESAIDFPVRQSAIALWLGAVSLLLALGTLFWAALQGDRASPETFFTAGGLLLFAGICFCAWFLRRLGASASAGHLTVTSLGIRSATRRRKRSLATIALLASGAFLVIAVSANRLDANLHAQRRSSGTGGFALIGESALSIVQDLNTQKGQEAFGLNANDLRGVAFVPMRVHAGDEASCLNLNLAQQPTLLGVNPESLDSRQPFTFAKAPDKEHPWRLLAQNLGENVVPAIGDENSIKWAMKKSVGDTIPYTDEQGRTFQVKIIGAVANSILQGKLLISEQNFTKRFPTESGYRMFLIDAPSNSVAEVSANLSRALQDVGMEITPAAVRLASFNAVQNTYLNTFQVLGGIGLLIGSLGMGIVVLRNVLERRAELAVLQAVGLRRRSLHWMVASENCGLLILGLLVGIVAALLAVWPALRNPGARLPLGTLALTLAGVVIFGVFSAWLATLIALKGSLLPALRNE